MNNACSIFPEKEERDSSKLEELVWNPENPMSDGQIDQFLIISRYVYNQQIVVVY